MEKIREEFGNRKDLIIGITQLSNTNNKINYELDGKEIYNSMCELWAETCQEWEISKMGDGHNDHCVCGHYIQQNCYIINSLNGNLAIVGNVCVEQFENPELIFTFKELRKKKKKIDKLFIKKDIIKLKVIYVRQREDDYLYKFCNNEMIEKIKNKCDNENINYHSKIWYFDKEDTYYLKMKNKSKKKYVKLEHIYINLKISF